MLLLERHDAAAWWILVGNDLYNVVSDTKNGSKLSLIYYKVKIGLIKRRNTIYHQHGIYEHNHIEEQLHRRTITKKMYVNGQLWQKELILDVYNVHTL